MEDWSCETVARVLQEELERVYPGKTLIEEVLRSLERNYINGKALARLSPSDWSQLIPQVCIRPCSLAAVRCSRPTACCSPCHRRLHYVAP